MLLSAIGLREIPIPEHIDIYHLTREMPTSEKTALECVMEVDEQRIMLEKEAERLAAEDCELHVMLHEMINWGRHARQLGLREHMCRLV